MGTFDPRTALARLAQTERFLTGVQQRGHQRALQAQELGSRLQIAKYQGALRRAERNEVMYRFQQNLELQREQMALRQAKLDASKAEREGERESFLAGTRDPYGEVPEGVADPEAFITAQGRGRDRLEDVEKRDREVAEMEAEERLREFIAQAEPEDLSFPNVLRAVPGADPVTVDRILTEERLRREQIERSERFETTLRDRRLGALGEVIDPRTGEIEPTYAARMRLTESEMAALRLALSERRLDAAQSGAALDEARKRRDEILVQIGATDFRGDADPSRFNPDDPRHQGVSGELNRLNEAIDRLSRDLLGGSAPTFAPTDPSEVDVLLEKIENGTATSEERRRFLELTEGR